MRDAIASWACGTNRLVGSAQTAQRDILNLWRAAADKPLPIAQKRQTANATEAPNTAEASSTAKAPNPAEAPNTTEAPNTAPNILLARLKTHRKPTLTLPRSISCSDKVGACDEASLECAAVLGGETDTALLGNP